MNTIQTYTGETGPNCGFEITKDNLRYRTDVLIGVVQALIDRIAEKEGIQLGVMNVGGNYPTFRLYEAPKEENNAEPPDLRKITPENS